MSKGLAKIIFCAALLWSTAAITVYLAASGIGFDATPVWGGRAAHHRGPEADSAKAKAAETDDIADKGKPSKEKPAGPGGVRPDPKAEKPTAPGADRSKAAGDKPGPHAPDE